MRTDIWVVVLGLGIAACLLGVRLLGEDVSQVPRFLLMMGAAFLCYFAALLILRRPKSRLSAVWIIALAALIQFAPYRGMPLWDTDAYRYHWDGLLLAHGVNPFQYAPGDHRLSHLRDAYWEPMDYKWIKTIYPPVTQFLLAGTYFLDQTPRRVLLLAMGFNLLTLWPLLLLLRARGKSDKWLIVYAWNPLVANEFAIGGHLDAISVFLLLAALCALQRNRSVATGALVALSVMAKTQMVLVAPLLLWRTRYKGVVAFVLVCLALMLPFVNVGVGDLVSGSLAYAQFWENNSGLFAVLRVLFGGQAARVVTGLAALGLMAWLTPRKGDVTLHCFIVLGAVLLLSPTFFPWYVSWVLPFACIYPTVTWVGITFLLLAPYVLYYDRSLAFTVRIPEIGLMYVMGAAEYVLWRRRRKPTPDSPPATSCPPDELAKP